MPNWCFNNMVVTGDPKQLKDFYNMLKKELSEDREVKTENSWDNMWLGNIFYKYYSEEDIKNKDIRCRGCINDFDYDESNDTITIQYESAWVSSYPSFDLLLNDFFPQLVEYTIAEECGCGIYINTDTTRKYFPERYMIDCCKNGEYIHEWFDTKPAFITFFNSIYKVNCRNYTECEYYAENHEGETDEDFCVVAEYAYE